MKKPTPGENRLKKPKRSIKPKQLISSSSFFIVYYFPPVSCLPGICISTGISAVYI